MLDAKDALSGYRYLVLAEGMFGPQTSKTANSAVRYLPGRVLAVIDSRHAGESVGDVLGFGGTIPVLATVEEGLGRGATALLIGIAPQGGQLPGSWRPMLNAAIDAGLDVVSGLHFHLSDDAELRERAAARGVRIHDLRKPPAQLPVSTGRARLVDALVVHTVGTDCNIGKMTAALQIRDALAARGTRVGFAATGQTGILIEGWGISVDAVVADFVGGAAEQLVLRAAEGNDVVLVEGQGSLVHPGYSGVTLGLLHGSMPDAMILCHQPSRQCPWNAAHRYDWMRLPSVPEMIRICESAIAPLRESRVIGIALNTWDLTDEQARDEARRLEDATGLPATDPVRFDPSPLAGAIVAAAERKRAGRAGMGG
ncbi:DUF1611 domain-containing protein [Longimicrobium sp.]|uniref:DUF1611 domain-containing protein n=1 Tax=Longimicrobium sp. TaxID=2029185 RepID=UPI002CE5AD5A|nr:DUF1611 domain-containing protein [Longimicrobium sp.]HSU17450.1 DUF1611 domain-containing protein [Longimicrobium sp.]